MIENCYPRRWRFEKREMESNITVGIILWEIYIMCFLELYLHVAFVLLEEEFAKIFCLLLDNLILKMTEVLLIRLL